MLSERLSKESTDRVGNIGTLAFPVAVRNGTVTKQRYMVFLNDLYHVVKHFCPTMSAGASRCPDNYSAVRTTLYEHTVEEKGHEEWVLNDCLAIGGQEFADEVRNGLPRHEIQAMNAFNYHVADRQHGAAALAMVFALELISQRMAGGLASGIAKALLLEGTAGITFLESHGPMDEDHLKEISAAIDTIDDPVVADIISNAVSVNLTLFSAIMS